MSQDKASRAKISLTDTLVIMGWKFDGVYLMSGTDAGKAIGKGHKSVGQFVVSNAANVLPDKDKVVAQVDNPEGGKLTLYTTRCVFAYWLYWCTKGNSLAYALVSALGVTDLDRLYDVAFDGSQKSEGEYQDERTLLTKLRQSRLECKAVHPGFQVRCEKSHYRAWDVHNYMTLQISGMDADMARELESILEPGSEIGLDHYQVWHDRALRQLAFAKRSFTCMKTPDLTWQEKVDKAIAKAKKQVQV